MKIRLGYNMGYAGTDSEWTENIPADIVEAGEEAINDYIAETEQNVYEEACQKISVWVTIEQ